MGRIIGKNIMLREYKEEDIEKIQKWVTDRDVTRYLSSHFDFSQSLKKTEEFVENAMDSDFTGFVIADKKTGEYIGQIDFNIDRKNRVGTLGIVIGIKKKQNQGIGTEAMELFINFGFNELNLNRIELDVMSYNKKAIRVYEKLGFKKEGCKRKKFYRDGKYHDIYIYGLLKEEW